MAIDPQFLDFMGSTVVVTPFASLSTDAYGSRNYAVSSSTAKCRLEQQLKIYKDKSGREVASNLVAYVAPYDNSTGQTAITINPTDSLAFPSGYTSSSILSVERHNDENGALMYYAVSL